MAQRVEKISISMERALAKRLASAAEAQGLSRSQLIERYCRDGLSEEELLVGMLGNPVLMRAFGQLITAPGVTAAMREVAGAELNDEQLLLFQQAFAPRPDPASAAGAVRRKKKQPKGSKGTGR